jgi:hypothetical protein
MEGLMALLAVHRCPPLDGQLQQLELLKPREEGPSHILVVSVARHFNMQTQCGITLPFIWVKLVVQYAHKF